MEKCTRMKRPQCMWKNWIFLDYESPREYASSLIARKKLGNDDIQEFSTFFAAQNILRSEASISRCMTSLTARNDLMQKQMVRQPHAQQSTFALIASEQKVKTAHFLACTFSCVHAHTTHLTAQTCLKQLVSALARKISKWKTLNQKSCHPHLVFHICAPDTSSSPFSLTLVRLSLWITWERAVGLASLATIHTPTKKGKDNNGMRHKNNMNKLERDHLVKRVRMICVSAVARTFTRGQSTGVKDSNCFMCGRSGHVRAVCWWKPAAKAQQVECGEDQEELTQDDADVEDIWVMAACTDSGTGGNHWCEEGLSNLWHRSVEHFSFHGFVWAPHGQVGWHHKRIFPRMSSGTVDLNETTTWRSAFVDISADTMFVARVWFLEETSSRHSQHWIERKCSHPSIAHILRRWRTQIHACDPRRWHAVGHEIWIRRSSATTSLTVIR